MQTKVLSSSELDVAASLLKNGELVAFPTETVYGLGAHLFRPDAIAKIFQAKGRPSDNPLIVHLSRLEQVEEVALAIPEEFYCLAEAFFPGPLTVILKRHPLVPLSVCAGLESVALRFPSHGIARELIEQAGAPLAAPSANISGKPSATEASHVLDDFQGKIAAVIEGGKSTLGIESTVLSLLDPDRILLLRPGSIKKEEIEQVLQRKIELASENQEKPLSPGMKYRHYAPNTPMKLFDDFEKLSAYLEQFPSKKRMVLSSKKEGKGAEFYLLNSQQLYSLLRLADAQGYQEILVFCDEIVQNDIALMNRLKKAAS